MNIKSTPGIGPTLPGTSDGGEIHPVGVPSVQRGVSISSLDAIDAIASFAVGKRLNPNGIDPLTSLLGIALTAGSPAWTGDPVPKMRALQKCLLEFGLQCSEPLRVAQLAGISVIERNIQLRLRLQQLHMTTLQQNAEPENTKS